MSKAIDHDDGFFLSQSGWSVAYSFYFSSCFSDHILYLNVVAWKNDILVV